MGRGVSAKWKKRTLGLKETHQTPLPREACAEGGYAALPTSLRVGPRQQWGWGQVLGGGVKGPAGATGTSQSNLGSEK